MSNQIATAMFAVRCTDMQLVQNEDMIDLNGSHDFMSRAMKDMVRRMLPMDNESYSDIEDYDDVDFSPDDQNINSVADKIGLLEDYPSQHLQCNMLRQLPASYMEKNYGLLTLDTDPPAPHVGPMEPSTLLTLATMSACMDQQPLRPPSLSPDYSAYPPLRDTSIDSGYTQSPKQCGVSDPTDYDRGVMDMFAYGQGLPNNEELRDFMRQFEENGTNGALSVAQQLANTVLNIGRDYSSEEEMLLGMDSLNFGAPCHETWSGTNVVDDKNSQNPTSLLSYMSFPRNLTANQQESYGQKKPTSNEHHLCLNNNFEPKQTTFGTTSAFDNTYDAKHNTFNAPSAFDNTYDAKHNQFGSPAAFDNMFGYTAPMYNKFEPKRQPYVSSNMTLDNAVHPITRHDCNAVIFNPLVPPPQNAQSGFPGRGPTEMIDTVLPVPPSQCSPKAWLHAGLEKCFLQFDLLQDELGNMEEQLIAVRVMTLAFLDKEAARMEQSLPVPRNPVNGTRVDVLISRQTRKRIRVLTLLRILSKLDGVTVHNGVLSQVHVWENAIGEVQLYRGDEIRMISGLNRSNCREAAVNVSRRGTDPTCTAQRLASSVHALVAVCRSVRKALWATLTITLDSVKTMPSSINAPR